MTITIKAVVGERRFNFPYQWVKTNYLPNDYYGSLNTYASAVSSKLPPMREFEVTLLGLAYYLDENKKPNYLVNKDRNIYQLWLLYRQVGLHKPFKYKHPVLGDLWVTFKKPLSIPTAATNSNGVIPEVSVLFSEYMRDYRLDRNIVNFITFGDKDFDFPYHALEVTTKIQDKVLPLYGGINSTVRRAGKLQRQFILNFQGMRYFHQNERIDVEAMPKFNMGRLEQFYCQYQQSKPFYYFYEGEGYIKVRFSSPLSVPRILPNSQGITEGFQCYLEEVIE